MVKPLSYLFALILLVMPVFNVMAQKSTEDEEELKKMLEEQSEKFITPSAANNQPTDSDTTKPSSWTKSWVVNISGNQASYKNWSQGGVNSLATTGTTNLKLKYDGEQISNSIRLNLQFGQTWLDESDSRKTADLINLRNKVDYFWASKAVSAFAELDFRTQFVKGYDDDYEQVVSNFMAPGYLTESIGVSYQPKPFFSAQLGLGLKQTFVRIDSLNYFYGLDENESMRSEGGVTIAFKMDKDFAETFNYSGELNTFTNLQSSLRSTDVIFRNELSGKLNSFLSTVIQFDLMFDDDVSKKVQMRQAISVGINIKLW